MRNGYYGVCLGFRYYKLQAVSYNCHTLSYDRNTFSYRLGR
jgi:hypothetical protein